jgi:hypothetical protein
VALLLRSPDAGGVAELLASEDARSAVDAFLLLFDASERASFLLAARQLSDLVTSCRPPTLGSPALLVAVAGDDAPMPKGALMVQLGTDVRLPWDNDGTVAAFCAALGTEPPLLVSLEAPQSVEALFARVIELATATSPRLPETHAARDARMRRRTLRRAATCAAGCATGMGVCYALFRALWWGGSSSEAAEEGPLQRRGT